VHTCDEAAFLERTGGDREFGREVVAVFVESAENILAQIAVALEVTGAAAVDVPGAAAVRALAHTLKGSAASVSADAIAHCAAALERANARRARACRATPTAHWSHALSRPLHCGAN
jgi:HPt (histidine-containing phosphotransfer) domain-containing protein